MPSLIDITAHSSCLQWGDLPRLTLRPKTDPAPLAGRDGRVPSVLFAPPGAPFSRLATQSERSVTARQCVATFDGSDKVRREHDLSEIPQMDLLQISTVAGGLATAVAAIANILLVLFVYRQITMQREFFTSQSQRDARTKISEAWQKHASELGSNPVVAQRLWSTARFWPEAKAEQITLMVAYIYTLNTLHYEFRFVEEGLHADSNFRDTLEYYVSTIDDEAELNCLEQLARTLGFDAKFVGAVEQTILERRGRVGAQKSE
jgi:hypothetical protein